MSINLTFGLIIIAACVLFWYIARYYAKKLGNEAQKQTEDITSRLDVIIPLLNQMKIEPTPERSTMSDAMRDAQIDAQFEIGTKSIFTDHEIVLNNARWYKPTTWFNTNKKLASSIDRKVNRPSIVSTPTIPSMGKYPSYNDERSPIEVATDPEVSLHSKIIPPSFQ